MFPDAGIVFGEFEGGEEKHGRKSIIRNESIFSMASEYKVEPVNVDVITEITDVFDFPVEIENGKVLTKQHKYFIPSMTNRYECPSCKGAKYVTCNNPSCLGKHEWSCPECLGSRKVSCETCHTSGYVKCKICNGRGEEKCGSCKGSGEMKCSHCGGDGYVGKPKDDNSNKCELCEGKGWHLCQECSSGLVKCETCSGKGEVKCNTCQGKGRVDCANCKAIGKIICDKCYSDEQRYGKIDCPTCKTMGVLGQIVYVETPVTEHVIERIICKNVKRRTHL